MNKFLVLVYVPLLEEEYNIYIPINKKIGTVKKIIINSIAELSEIPENKIINLKLYDKESSKIYNKYKDNFIVKYRGFLLFIISGILAFFFINFMGNGLNSIGFIYGVSSLVVVVLIFLFRFFMTLVYGLGKVSGGLVVPTLVIGGLIGYFTCLLFSRIGLFDLYYVSLYAVVSMCLFFSLIFNMPYTGAMLFVSTILYSNCNILSIIPFTFFVFIIFVLFNKANKAIKNKGYYSYLLNINDINC